MGRNFLAHSSGDAPNAVLAAARYNFSLLLKWLCLLCALFLAALGGSRARAVNCTRLNATTSRATFLKI